MDKRIIEQHFENNYVDFYSKYLPGVKSVGETEHQALCPFHDDKNPSFNFNSSTGQFYCHGCQAKGNIFNFYAKIRGLNVKQNFPDVIGGIANDFGIPFSGAKRKFVKAYDYVDEDGGLLFQVCRFEPKTFQQRRPGGNGNWVWNLDGVQRVLYRLPGVAKANLIIIAEGEKDSDSLCKLGFTATTSPMGAGKWRDDYNVFLKNKEIVLIPDNDNEGREHMRRVAISLQDVAASVKMLELPDLPEKGDVSDFIARAGDEMAAAGGLLALIENAGPYTPPSEKPQDDIRNEQSGLDFPGCLMTGTAGDFAKLYSSYMEAPPVFLYFGFLSVLGSILSDKLILSSELRPEPRLYTILLGESGDDRKSTAIKAVTSFFREYFPGSLNLCHGIGSAEGLQKKLSELPDGKLVLIYDELKALVSKCRIEASVLLPCITSLFEDNEYENRTKKSDIRLENVRLSFLAASTLRTYENVWTSQFLDIGFTNRLFLVPGSGQRKNPIPLKIPLLEKMVVARQVASIFEITADKIEMSLTKEATELYNSWYMSLNKSVHARRIDTYAMRLLPLAAINEHKTEIDIDIVKQVTAIMNWQLLIREQLDPIDADNKVAVMEEKIRRKLKLGPLTKREIMKSVHYERDGIWIFNMALKNLAEEISFNREVKTWEVK